jgi:ABC-type glutathione transport system ATPase component
MVARLGFAVATDVEPDILIVDEVLSVGDAAFQQKSAERIQGFRATGATILLVSHNLEAVKTMCTRAVWLEQGQIIADGSADAVVHQYLDRDQAAEARRLAEEAGPQATRRWGSRQVEIVRVRLTNGRGEEQTIFETGESLALHLDYQAHVAISSPIFGIAIHRQDGVHITGPNTAFAGVNLPVLNGQGTVTYIIPHLPLLDGLYEISVAVVSHSNAETFDYHDRSYPFRVVNQNGCVQERYGLVTLQGEWRHVT